MWQADLPGLPEVHERFKPDCLLPPVPGDLQQKLERITDFAGGRMSWNLPDGCTDEDIDMAAPGYWDPPEPEQCEDDWDPEWESVMEMMEATCL
jgi:hypothetical protein